MKEIKQETSVKAGGVTLMRIVVCSGCSNPRNTNRWTQISAQGQTNKLDWKNFSDDNNADKSAFLLLREGVTSPMRAKYIVKFYS